MLVLSRKTGNSIRIGDEIEVVVLEVSKGRVKLGFSGPKHIPVRRGELTHAIGCHEPMMAHGSCELELQHAT